GRPAPLCRRRRGRGVAPGGRHRRCSLRRWRRGRGQPPHRGDGGGRRRGPAVHVSGAGSAWVTRVGGGGGRGGPAGPVSGGGSAWVPGVWGRGAGAPPPLRDDALPVQTRALA